MNIFNPKETNSINTEESFLFLTNWTHFVLFAHLGRGDLENKRSVNSVGSLRIGECARLMWESGGDYSGPARLWLAFVAIV